ncbi:MAG TPA: sigma-70 family RNA polymerase sigma factor [Candidatus Binatia bacterium]|nr:sigma-70 family RNA polymerase sigma factor [Candidatus Binatia bacterium]
MARRALWRVGTAKDAVPRLAHLDRDRPLVEAAKRDPAQFDALYRRYLARVYSFAYYELGDHHAAEDVTEATFVSALTNLHRFEERARPADGEGASTFRVWLFQIARNEIAGERRRARRRPVEPIGETLVADPLSVEDEAVRRDQARAAWRAVGRLPGERRQAIVLRFVDELSTAEIAGVLGKSEGSVRVLIHRALKSVAKELGASRGPRSEGRSQGPNGSSGKTSGLDA